jgi:hypothetical protein
VRCSVPSWDYCLELLGLILECIGNGEAMHLDRRWVHTRRLGMALGALSAPSLDYCWGATRANMEHALGTVEAMHLDRRWSGRRARAQYW